VVTQRVKRVLVVQVSWLQKLSAEFVVTNVLCP